MPRFSADLLDQADQLLRGPTLDVQPMLRQLLPPAEVGMAPVQLFQPVFELSDGKAERLTDITDRTAQPVTDDGSR